jgi:hypothetical protein
VNVARARVPAALARLQRGGMLRLWPWLPLVFAAVYAIVLLASVRSVVQGIYLSADVVSAPYIGELYGQAPPGAHVVLGNFPWYTTLWFEQATHGLPGHRQIWEVGPWVISLLGVGLVAWSTSRAAGRWAGVVVAVALGCAGPGLLGYQFAPSIHAFTFVHVAILGAFLVWCSTRAEGRLGAHLLSCALLAAVTAAGVASDRLLVVAGVIPFMLAGVALGWCLAAPAGRRIALSCVLVGAGALAGGAVIVSVMEAQDVRAAHFTINLAAFDGLAPNFRILAEGGAYLFNGDFSGMRLDFAGGLAVACALALAIAVVAVTRYGRGWWRGWAMPPRRPTAGTGDAARVAHVAFWSLAASLLPVFLLFSSIPVDRYTGRYLLSAGYGVVALVPLVALLRGNRGRALVTAGVCVVVAGSIAGLLRRDIQDNPSHYPTGSLSGPLLRLARAEGVKYGYAGYWDAAPLTWQAKAEIQLYPVMGCVTGPQLCQVGPHRITSWYTPRPHTRTMLVKDRAQENLPERGLGRPDKVVEIGQLTVYFYPYDIAYRFRR